MKWLRKLIGTEDIYNQINDLNHYITGLRGAISAMQGQIIASNRGMSRIIAKIDPAFARDEFDPTRRRESDELSAQIIRKLIAEHVASNRLDPTDGQ